MRSRRRTIPGTDVVNALYLLLSNLTTLTHLIFRTIKFGRERIIENAVLNLSEHLRVHFSALTYKTKYVDFKISYVMSVRAINHFMSANSEYGCVHSTSCLLSADSFKVSLNIFTAFGNGNVGGVCGKRQRFCSQNSLSIGTSRSSTTWRGEMWLLRCFRSNLNHKANYRIPTQQRPGDMQWTQYNSVLIVKPLQKYFMTMQTV